MTNVVPFIDTHVHFWDHALPGMEWMWLRSDFDQPRYTAAEFRDESAALGVTGVIHLQAADPMPDPAEETAWLDAIAALNGWPNAVIGACRLSALDASVLLRRHATFRRFRGIRDLSFSPSEDLDALAPAMAVVNELGLSIELRLPVEDFSVLRAVADRWADCTLVLSHAGIPFESQDRGDAMHHEWEAGLRQLADAPNVVCKISGIVGRADPGWTTERIRPWVRSCIEVFGPNRCMFGTNWPLAKFVTSYAQLVEAYRELTSDLSDGEQHNVFHGTAERVYKVPLGG